MVSGPLSDLLNESTDSTDSAEGTFEQENTLENADGKILEIHRYEEDGVKMVAINGYKLPLDSLLEMVEFDDFASVKEDDTFQITMLILVTICMSICATSIFLAVLKEKGLCPFSPVAFSQ